MKDKKCPCVMCKIEREKDYSCRMGNCNSYLSWVKKMKKKNASEELKGRTVTSKAFSKK